jgi:hypothetical protein
MKEIREVIYDKTEYNINGKKLYLYRRMTIYEDDTFEIDNIDDETLYLVESREQKIKELGL